MKSLIQKLERIAEQLAAEKPTLHFFGLVHRTEAPDVWDLIVSSDQLAPRTTEGLKEVGERLKKVLRADEIVRLSRIVILPKRNEVISWLKNNQQLRAGELSFLHPSDRFDQAIVLWPVKKRARQTV